jgi:hypothetical protein
VGKLSRMLGVDDRCWRCWTITITLGLVCLFCISPNPLLAREFDARDAGAIRSAMQITQPGDTISIPPGDYEMGEALVTGNSGTGDNPTHRRWPEIDHHRPQWCLRAMEIRGQPRCLHRGL